jgi:hypothetical protein
MNIRDLSTLERTATWLEELIRACQPLGSLYCENPKLTADVTRKGKALRTSLQTLRDFLDQQEKK